MADTKLFMYVSILITIGVIMSYSLSEYTVIIYNYQEFHFLARQLFSAIIGILIMWMFSQVDPDKNFEKIGFTLFLFTLSLMVLMPFLPESITSSAGGAKRWIRLPGFSLAPSEFFKLGFIFFLAWSFSRKFAFHNKRSIKEEFLIILPYLAVFIVVVFLIAVMQNDLGQVVLLAITLGLMLIFAGGSLQLFGILFFGIIGLGTITIITSSHRILRVKLWWANAQDSILGILPHNIANYIRVDNLPEPYQIHHATNAIYNGGFFGKGLGEGLIKLGFLSEVHTDMVLAGLSEELGFIGLMVCIFLFCIVIYRIFKIANHLKNQSHSLFCIGVALLIGFSFIINAFGVSGITPIKGIAVPFLTYGGSSLIANCIAIGIVLSLSRQSRI
ncbi:putative peptidoglycan glycosyltransferase FtsW [Helicobacter sp. 13S00477-4]|uniref:FtsW/RodA/SpoVE family cell cycle protein n=1 Tax=Helicobacter sp. 13S00477-4 TaxID=1905759 RepID=UPI000BA7A615|nr:putative peptidoglycan glycosyltransferase FtsW [Helicobacter sp. 13S00477-4]PAF52379.1 cell division protein FtsW [Helicobacter sp. 13S00477-4]